ncbi:16122_t:CDS:10 [Entrophospora sp. SA101]|nr:16122_t:CDS:10 [Entrophospora sp. SA101]
MSSIKPIDSTSIHKICSGQVILDLAMAAKELVENSLDAKAKTIEIRFKEYGLQSIEVIDDGTGIHEQNYESLALKHHTSKLSNFEDLLDIESFGFRGEALSSLCALSKLTVTTCTEENVPTGAKLDKRGTSIMLQNIFELLPVRYHDFKKNIKREFAKTLVLLQAYALICENIRIICTNQVKKSARTKLLSTNGTNNNIKDNIINLFGSKLFDHLITLDLKISFNINNKKINKISSGNSENQNEDLKYINIFGYISKPIKGCGRGSNDRQYFYINGRPYKRTIFIHDEDEIIESLKNEMNKLFEPFRSTFTCFNVGKIELPKHDTNESDNNISGIVEKATLHTKRSSRNFNNYSLDVNDETTSNTIDLDQNKDVDSDLQNIIRCDSNLQNVRNSSNRPKINVDFNFETFKLKKKKNFISNYESKEIINQSKTDNENYLKHAGILVRDNVIAEQVLEKVITKKDFSLMEIIGQFNRGFIITKLWNSDDGFDLFIIDQHASDEKYNFETLQLHTKIQTQPLISPRALQLTATEELTATENLDILQSNGFELLVDLDAPPTNRVKLIAQPIIKNMIFEIKDLEELIHMLSENPRTLVRCSKAKKMFASKACHKSVMVGDALNKQQMTKVWNLIQY